MGPGYAVCTQDAFYGVNSRVLEEVKTSSVHIGKSCFIITRLFSWHEPILHCEALAVFELPGYLLMYHFDTRTVMLESPLRDCDGHTQAQPGPSTTHSELPSLSSLEGTGDYAAGFNWKREFQEELFL